MRLDNEQLERIDHSHVSKNLLKIHTSQIRRQLRKLGAVQYDLILPETNALPLVIQPNEIIEGIVYGRYKQDSPDSSHITIGRGALIATDRRVLLIDRKPLFMKCSEISHRVINAVSYSRVGFMGTVTLHTKIGDIRVRTFNQNCAHCFVEAVENDLLTPKEQSYDYAT